MLTFLLEFFVGAAPVRGRQRLLLKLYDFYPTWPITLGWYSVVYSIFQFVIFGAIIKAFPGLFGWRTNKKKKASAKA